MSNSSDDFNIERCTAESKYCIIPNEIAQSPDLSANATMVLVYLLSCKADWNITPRNVWKAKNISRNQTYDAFNELCDAGYMERTDVFKGNLKAGCKYKVAYFKKFLRRPGSRDTEIREAYKKNDLHKTPIETPKGVSRKSARERTLDDSSLTGTQKAKKKPQAQISQKPKNKPKPSDAAPPPDPETPSEPNTTLPQAKQGVTPPNSPVGDEMPTQAKYERFSNPKQNGVYQRLIALVGETQAQTLWMRCCKEEYWPDGVITWIEKNAGAIKTSAARVVQGAISSKAEYKDDSASKHEGKRGIKVPKYGTIGADFIKKQWNAQNND